MLGLRDISRIVADQSDYTLNVVLTEACPVGCAHCAPSCVPNGRDTVDIAALDAWLGTGDPVFRYIVATGGEPFARERALEALCRLGQQRCLPMAALTSAFWAISPTRAKIVLRKLKDAGLHSLTVSVDRPHLERLPQQRIRNAIVAAKELGLGVAISFRHDGLQVSAADSDWLAEVLADTIPLIDGLTSAPIQPLGRGADGAVVGPVDVAGPRLCPAWGVTVLPRDRIALCCGALAEPEAHLQAGHLTPDGAWKAVHRARSSALGLILRTEGLTALLETACVAAWGGSSKRSYHPFDWCGLCSDLLADPEAMSAIATVHGRDENLRRLAVARLLALGDGWPLAHLEQLENIACG